MQGSESQIDYERLVSEAMRDAMRNVLRSVLIDVAKTGLPGDHHFYISFSTTAPGVSLSKRLMEKYPEEMTIVLQHRFWDLIVHSDRFEVKLQFNSIPEKLVIPFEAIRVFVDPSVRFGHQFDDGDADAAADGDSAGAAIRGIRSANRTPSTGAPRNTEKRRATTPRKKSDRDIAVVDVADDKQRPLGAAAAETASNTEKVAEPPPTTAPAAEPANESSKVISLDKFRKK
jgi:uncharacterized protein